jgi:glycosyltransferase involved in cell wall biosynthesis
LSTEARVTVVIPVWDEYCARLQECVRDLMTQEGVAMDVIIVDNASDSEIPDLPADVRVLRLARRVSVGAARNAGGEHVQTPYVLFLDADDRLLPGTVQFLAGELDGAPAAVAAICKHLLWDRKTDRRVTVDRSPKPVVYRLARSRHLLGLATLRFNIFPIVGCAAIRTEVFRDAGGFGDGNLGEDWELCAALAWRGRIRFHRRPGRLYAVEEGSLWHRSHPRELLERRYDAFQARVLRDRRVPAYARLLVRHWIRRAHSRDIARLTAKGDFRPATTELRDPAGT